MGEEEKRKGRKNIVRYSTTDIRLLRLFDELLGLAHWPVHSLSYLLHVGQACFSSSSPPPEATTSPATSAGVAALFPQFFRKRKLNCERKGRMGKKERDEKITTKYFSKCLRYIFFLLPYFLFSLEKNIYVIASWFVTFLVEGGADKMRGGEGSEKKMVSKGSIRPAHGSRDKRGDSPVARPPS